MILLDRIQALETGAHDAECREVIAELIRRLKIAQHGANQMCTEVDESSLSNDDKMRIIDIGFWAISCSDLEIA